MLFFIGLSILVPLVVGDLGTPAGGKRTLVVLEDETLQATHTRFFGSLEARGHELTYRVAGEEPIEMESFGEKNFDNVVLFVPNLRDNRDLSSDALVHFLQDGGNLLLAGAKQISPAIRDIAAECGVDFHEPGSIVTDHFHAIPSDDAEEEHSRIVASDIPRSRFAVGRALAEKPAAEVAIAFEGTGLTVDEDNYLLFPLLRAPSTSYSAATDERVPSRPPGAGEETILVTGVQARNNARAVVAGSLWMFSDEAYATKVSDGHTTLNAEFCDAMSRWAFQEQGVLRAREATHRRTDGRLTEKQGKNYPRPNLPKSVFPDPEVAPNSDVYRVKDDIEWSVIIEEYNGTEWVPYVADDVQWEAVMLDAWTRAFMETDGSGRFWVRTKLPDQKGIYKLRVLYRRPHRSVVEMTTPITLRPLHHNEYDRFILSAYPYYTAAFTVMAAVFVFLVLFLRSTDKKPSRSE